MELGKYQGVLRNLKRTKGGLRTVVYDPSIEDTTVDFPDIEQPKMGFEDGGVVQREGFNRGTNPPPEGSEEFLKKFLKDRGVKNWEDLTGKQRYDYTISLPKYLKQQELIKGKITVDELAKKLGTTGLKLRNYKTKSLNPRTPGEGVTHNKITELLGNPIEFRQMVGFKKGEKNQAGRLYYNNPTDEQIDIIKSYLPDAKKSNIIQYQILDRMKKMTSGKKGEKFLELLRTEDFSDPKTLNNIKSLFPNLKLTGNEIATIATRIAQVANGQKFRGVDFIDVDPSLGSTIIKKMESMPFGNPFATASYRIALNELDKNLPNKKGSFLGYRQQLNKELSKIGLDPKKFNVDEYFGVSLGGLKNEFAPYSVFSRALQSDLNQKQAAQFQGTLSRYIDRLDSIKDKKQKFNEIDKINKLISAREKDLGIELPKFYKGTAEQAFGKKRFKELTEQGLDFSTTRDYSIKIPKGAMTQKEILKSLKSGEDVVKTVGTITKDAESYLKKVKPQDAVNIISSVACPNQYADGGRVNFKKGSNCFLRGAEIINDAKAGNPSALQKVRKYLKTPGARLGLGALAELGIEGLFAVEGIAEGKPFDQVLGESILGLAGFGSTEEEQILKSADPKDIEKVKAYQKKLANEEKLSANVGFEKTVQPETGEESTEDFFTVESLRPAIKEQKEQLQKDFKDPNLEKEEEAYGRAYKNYLEENKKRAEEQGYRKPFQYIKEEIYDPTGKKITEAYEAVKDLFAEGGRVGMQEGGDPKDKMKTPFDKPTLPLDPNQIPQVQSPGRRGFIKGVGFIGAGIAAFAAGLLRLGRKESAKKLVQKAATYGGRRIDGVPEIILDLIGNIKTKGKIIDAPKPGSGPVVYRYDNYEYAEDVNGFTVSKINDQGDYGYSEEVFQFEKDPETGAVFFDDVTVRPDGDGKLKDVEYGVDYDAYNEIADDLHKMNKLNPNDTRFRDKAQKWIDEDKQINQGIEPKPGTELD